MRAFPHPGRISVEHLERRIHRRGGWLAAFGLAVSLVSLIGVPALAQPGRAASARAQNLPSADKIVGAYLKAVGGKKRVAAISDATYEWSVRRGVQTAGTVRTQRRAPASARTDIRLDDEETSAAASAQSAWMRGVDGSLRTLVGGEALASKLQAALDASGLVNYRKLNVLARTVALDNALVEPAYIVEFSTREGARLRYWFAASSRLLVQVEDVARRTTLRFADYRAEGGVLEPHRVELRRDGAEVLTLVLERVRYNAGLASSIFDPPGQPGLDIPALLREVGRNQAELDERVNEYTFTVKSTQREINDKGELKKEKVFLHEVYPVSGGGWVLKLIGEDGTPLAPEQMAKEEKRASEELEKSERESGKRKQKRERERAERAKKNGGGATGEDEDDALGISIFLRASEFIAPRRERFRDRDAIVFDFRPRDDFRPSNREEELVSKLVGVMWVDPVDNQVMRLEARLSEGVKIGGGLLASIRSGASASFEQTRLPDGVWLPRSAQVSISAKVFLVAGLKIDHTREYGDYRRFSTKTGDAVLDAPKEKNEKL